MKRVLLIVVWVWLGFSLCLNAKLLIGQAQLLPGILAKMEVAQRNLKSLRAALEQQSVNVQLGTKDTDYGTLIYTPADKGRLRIDYTKPSPQVLSIIGDEFLFYQPRLNQALKTTFAKALKGRTGGQMQLLGLNKSVRSLAQSYQIEILNDESIEGLMTSHLRFTPKERGQFAALEVWVSQQSWLPLQHKFIAQNGDYTIVKLTKVELNLKLRNEDFIVKLPGNTVVIDRMEDE